MIKTKPQLKQAQEALMCLNKALSALRKRIEKKRPMLYAIMATDYISNMQSIKREIDAYRENSVTAGRHEEKKGVQNEK